MGPYFCTAPPALVPAACSPGASEETLDATEADLGITLCPALRVLYRVHDGQELEFDRQVGRGGGVVKVGGAGPGLGRVGLVWGG
jgi:hypothetical protein